MKFISGLPKDDDQNIDSHWIEVKTIKNRIILGIVLGLLITVPIFEMLSYLLFQGETELAFIKKVVILLILIPLHEFFHFIVFPKIKDATVGVSLKNLIFYVSTNHEMTKVRTLIVSVLPLMLFSVIPFILLFQFDSEVILYVFFYNTIGSGIDIITFYYISRLPNNISIKFIGAKCFYKKNL